MNQFRDLFSLEEMGTEAASRFFGKYRGTVITNEDPFKMGRLLVTVPDVYHIIPSSWAMPCVPFAGLQTGAYVLPPQGAGVWVEFEQGDLDYPIWTGCWWGSTEEVPAMALAATPACPPVVIQSQAQNRIIVSSMPGEGLTLETGLGPAGPMIRIDRTGITISDGKGGMITITGGVVTVNQGALVVK